jgi:hypothetical protein
MLVVASAVRSKQLRFRRSDRELEMPAVRDGSPSVSPATAVRALTELRRDADAMRGVDVELGEKLLERSHGFQSSRTPLTR